MAHKFEVRCNNCEWEGYEDSLSLVEIDATDSAETPTAFDVGTGTPFTRLKEEPEKKDFIKGCPHCLTDSCLTDIE
jgi:hypothetical protein